MTTKNTIHIARRPLDDTRAWAQRTTKCGIKYNKKGFNETVVFGETAAFALEEITDYTEICVVCHPA